MASTWIFFFIFGSLSLVNSLDLGSHLLHHSCEVTTLSGEVIPKRVCGCDKEEKVPCELGPISVPGKNGALSLKFCKTSYNWTSHLPYGGILRRACLIKEDSTSPSAKVFQAYNCPHPVGKTVGCSLGPIRVEINGTKALAYLCNRLQNGNKIDEKNIIKDSSCVELKLPKVTLKHPRIHPGLVGRPDSGKSQVKPELKPLGKPSGKLPLPVKGGSTSKVGAPPKSPEKAKVGTKPSDNEISKAHVDSSILDKISGALSKTPSAKSPSKDKVTLGRKDGLKSKKS